MKRNLAGSLLIVHALALALETTAGAQPAADNKCENERLSVQRARQNHDAAFDAQEALLDALRRVPRLPPSNELREGLIANQCMNADGTFPEGRLKPGCTQALEKYNAARDAEDQIRPFQERAERIGGIYGSTRHELDEAQRQWQVCRGHLDKVRPDARDAKRAEPLDQLIEHAADDVSSPTIKPTGPAREPAPSTASAPPAQPVGPPMPTPSSPRGFAGDAAQPGAGQDPCAVYRGQLAAMENAMNEEVTSIRSMRAQGFSIYDVSAENQARAHWRGRMEIVKLHMFTHDCDKDPAQRSASTSPTPGGGGSSPPSQPPKSAGLDCTDLRRQLQSVIAEVHNSAGFANDPKNDSQMRVMAKDSEAESRRGAEKLQAAMVIAGCSDIPEVGTSGPRTASVSPSSPAGAASAPPSQRELPLPPDIEKLIEILGPDVRDALITQRRNNPDAYNERIRRFREAARPSPQPGTSPSGPLPPAAGNVPPQTVSTSPSTTPAAASPNARPGVCPNNYTELMDRAGRRPSLQHSMGCTADANNCVVNCRWVSDREREENAKKAAAASADQPTALKSAIAPALLAAPTLPPPALHQQPATLPPPQLAVHPPAQHAPKTTHKPQPKKKEAKQPKQPKQAKHAPAQPQADPNKAARDAATAAAVIGIIGGIAAGAAVSRGGGYRPSGGHHAPPPAPMRRAH